MRSIFTVLLSAFLLISCSQKELLPGEDRFIAELEQAEQKMLEAGDTACAELKEHYAKAETAFKQMMPSLKGLGLQKRDARLGVLRKFTEDHC